MSEVRVVASTNGSAVRVRGARGRDCRDLFTAETAEDAEVFGQDRRDIVM